MKTTIVPPATRTLSRSSSEDSADIVVGKLRAGAIRRGTSKDMSHGANGGHYSNSHYADSIGFSRPRKSVDQNSFAQMRYDEPKENEHFANNLNGIHRESTLRDSKTSKVSPDTFSSGNQRIKRFESHSKMIFETQIQKAKYKSLNTLIAVGNKQKESKSNGSPVEGSFDDPHRRDEVDPAKDGSNSFHSEVDDMLYLSADNKRQNYRTDPNTLRESDMRSKGRAVNGSTSNDIDESELEWLMVTAKLTREEALPIYLTKSKATQSSDDGEKRPNRINTLSSLEKIFGSVHPPQPLNRESHRGQVTIPNRYLDRDIPSREVTINRAVPQNPHVHYNSYSGLSRDESLPAELNSYVSNTISYLLCLIIMYCINTCV